MKDQDYGEVVPLQLSLHGISFFLRAILRVAYFPRLSLAKTYSDRKFPT